MSQRTALGRVRGLGSAKEGAAHWWAQRLTAIALVPLSLWFVASVVALVGGDHAAVIQWLSNPVADICMLLLILAACHHAQLGLQVVIEDYVHTGWMKLTGIVAVKLAAAIIAVAAIFAVLKIALGG